MSLPAGSDTAFTRSHSLALAPGARLEIVQAIVFAFWMKHMPGTAGSSVTDWIWKVALLVSVSWILKTLAEAGPLFVTTILYVTVVFPLDRVSGSTSSDWAIARSAVVLNLATKASGHGHKGPLPGLHCPSVPHVESKTLAG